MDRHEVNQALLDLYPAPAYLEIGVDQGVTFSAIRAARKVAVDVRFAFDWQTAAADPANRHCRYHETSSDDYFGRGRGGERFDLVFIDGLHSYEQTLRDLINAITCLTPTGIVVVDDVLPSTYAASLPDLDLSRRFWAATANPDGSWMGDVFRLAFFIESFLPGFSYATVAENHGQMVLWREYRPGFPTRTVEETARMQFVDTVMRRESFHIAPFAEIRARVAAWIAGGGAG